MKKVKFKCPVYHQGVNFAKGEIYELNDDQVAAIDRADYDEVTEKQVQEHKAATKGAPKNAENK